MEGNLTWNKAHTVNLEHQYCYCKRDRNLLDICLQCRQCRNWFHASCTSISHPPDLPFVTNYIFECRNCSKKESELFERTTAGWKDICSATIANLIMDQIVQKNGSQDRQLYDSKNADLMKEWHPEQYYFNKKEIIPFVDKHWKSICTERARTTTWWATLGSCLYSSKDAFIARDEGQRSAASDFCLTDANLWNIRPAAGHSTGKSGASTARREKRKAEDTQRKTEQQQRRSTTPTTTTTPSPRAVSPLLPGSTLASSINSTGSNTDHPYNKFGFKYIPCQASILPHVGYQQAEPEIKSCGISVADKSPYVSVSGDGLTVTTEKGFRMCRANVGVQEGNWYWEAIVTNARGSAGSDGPHVRIGWARREACLNAPVGYDAYGYGYRDLTGDKLFCSRPQKYGEPFQSGDVIGLYIHLPRKDPAQFKSPARKRIPIVFKDQLWFEEKDYRPSKELEAFADPIHNSTEDEYEPRIIPGSYITVYKNGVSQGVMFKDLIDFKDFGKLPEMVAERQAKKRKKQKHTEDEFDGSKHLQWSDDPPVEDDGTLGYYPAVSVFKGAVVTCNFGPDFRYPPQVDEEWKPMSQRYSEYMAEEAMWDMLDEVAKYFKRNAIK